ncbi:MAG TPA: DUF5683 domain-containing protein [Chitinophaga sp.]|uniref:DUF5683 domain-containing protein n=1 Tax=Chitinophaga sp. TaxID=1869181 RepID=UPI002C7A482C|nr:DUF5683 domain-containing protein [Chitinophaga sp.]HVI49008.1 DUF5683 domain-containing protein [Chitinophaga sp.]
MANKAGRSFLLFRSISLLLLAIMATGVYAQVQPRDTLRPGAKPVDTLAKKNAVMAKDTSHIARDTSHKALVDSNRIRVNAPAPHSPRKAALYSAVLPGLGQAYNREYWKIPLVYAALGTCTYFFIWNMNNYKDYRDAYRLRVDGNPDTKDNHPEYTNPESLKVLRDYYRQNLDYSVLFFVLGYGLNIVDATVFAHLRSFDMSNDLTLRVSPTLINNRTLGIGINISVGGKKNRKNNWFAGR